jgi:ATP-dependent protease ClpP protease subunit
MPRDNYRFFARTGGPTYRFHGSTPPRAGERTPLRAQIGASEPDDAGVVTMRLYDPIDSWGDMWGVSASEFAAALDEVPDAKEIRLHINSPGGEVYEAIAILNQLRQHPATVTAIVDGLAASAASFIATGADRVIMGQNAQLMVHDAWGVCVGAAVDMRDLADRLDQLSNNIASIYQAKAGGTVQDWRNVMLNETWYTPRRLSRPGSPIASTARRGGRHPGGKAAFDLSRFKHKGRAKAPAPLQPRRPGAARRPDERSRRSGVAQRGGTPDRGPPRTGRAAAGRGACPGRVDAHPGDGLADRDRQHRRRGAGGAGRPPRCAVSRP